MSFLNLKKLTEGKNKIYLVLVLWTLIGYILYEFLPPGFGVIVFLPLIGICLIFFFASIFTRKEVHEFSNRRIIFHLIIGLIFIIPLFYIGIYLFYVGFISYIILTAFFTMYTCYRAGIKAYDTIEKFPTKLKGFSEWSLFLGGSILSIVIIFGTAFVLNNLLGYTRVDNQFNSYFVAWILIFIIIALSVTTGIVSTRGILNSWIGVFFVGIAIYAGYQMYSITSSLQPDDGMGYGWEITLIIFIGNLLLLLNSFGNLLGEHSEFLKEKLRIFKGDTILLWLMFSTASYKFAEGLPGMEASLFKNIVVFLLFIPLMVFLGIYGLNFYIKLHREGQLRALKPEPEQIVEETESDRLEKEE